MKTARWWCFATIGILLAASTSAARGDTIEYSAGHADIGLAYEDNELYLHYHFIGDTILDGQGLGGAELEVDPEDVYTIVPSDSGGNPGAGKVVNPGGVYATALGQSAGDDLWILPQSNVSGLPFLGFATEELSGPWTDLGFRLISFNYEGNATNPQFDNWQTSFFGGAEFFMTTADGITSSDDFPALLGSHDHLNWGFTDPGLYEITIEGYGTHGTDGFKSDSALFSFLVGEFQPVSAVPEPTSLALFGIGSLCAVAIGRRHRTKKSEAE